jgi:hypothetical protein
MVLLQITENSLLLTCQVYDRCENYHSNGLATSQLSGIQTLVGSFIRYIYFKVYIYVTVPNNRFLFT